MHLNTDLILLPILLIGLIGFFRPCRLATCPLGHARVRQAWQRSPPLVLLALWLYIYRTAPADKCLRSTCRTQGSSQHPFSWFSNAYVAYVRMSHPNSTVSASIYKIFSARDSLRLHPEFQCEPTELSCSSMTSCAEAFFHQEHCDVSGMDGDHDGIPCEQQWCN